MRRKLSDSVLHRRFLKDRNCHVLPKGAVIASVANIHFVLCIQNTELANLGAVFADLDRFVNIRTWLFLSCGAGV